MSVEILLDIFLFDTFKFGLGKNFQKFPAEVERFFDASVYGETLRNVLLFKFFGKFCV